VTLVNAYATLNQLKTAIRMGTADTADDTILEMAIESASRLIDDDCDRVFYSSGTAVTRSFVANDGYVVDIDDNITVASVATDDDGSRTFSTTWGTADFQEEPLNNLNGGQDWPTTRLRAIASRSFPCSEGASTVRVTGTWGFGTAIPTIITQACVLQSSRIYKRLDAPFGVAGFGDMGAVRVSRTDPDVYALISKYRRAKVATA
jgi:hypothetical protein